VRAIGSAYKWNSKKEKPMRCVVGLCMFALAVPVFAGNPGDPDPAFEGRAWIGKPSDELIAEWGKPKKAKPHGEGGKVLVYRVRFYGSEMVADTRRDYVPLRFPGFTIRAVDCGDGPDSVTPRVIATQKVKFYLDAQGIVRGQESAPRKWKRKKP